MTTTETSDPHLPTSLIALGTYSWPQGQRQRTLEQIIQIFRSELPWAQPPVPAKKKRLKHTRRTGERQLAHTRLSEIIEICIDDAYADWLGGSGTGLRAFVHAPANSQFLGDWAERKGIKVVRDRAALDALSVGESAVFEGFENCIHRCNDAMARNRDLLAALASSKGRVIVSCNSWAWRFLCATTTSDLLIADTQTIPAFDAAALASLIKPIVDADGNAAKFISEDSGEPIFATTDDEPVDPYFKRLARRCLGLPWVAIEMFFNDMLAAEQNEDDDPDERTWLRLPDAPKLPRGDDDLVHFVLQNLLIHEPCSRDLLLGCLPRPVPVGIWQALIDAEFIVQEGAQLRHDPAHYPAIRNALSAEGMNVDAL